MTDHTTAPAADPQTMPAETKASTTHAMRSVAMVFMAGNLAVLAVFGAVVATGHLDVGHLADLALTTSATAAPTN